MTKKQMIAMLCLLVWGFSGCGGAKKERFECVFSGGIYNGPKDVGFVAHYKDGEMSVIEAGDPHKKFRPRSPYFCPV